jgi:hypothetical protein
VYPGSFGDPGDLDEPRGWADEGLAELLAGLAYDAAGGFTAPLREAHLAALCGAPRRPLGELLAQRDGYDRAGTFDYANAWAFAHFLHTRAPEVRRRLYLAFRSGSYRLTDFATLAGVGSVEELSAEWHAAIDAWCAPPG